MRTIRQIIPEVIQSLSERKPDIQVRIQEVWQKLFVGKEAESMHIIGFKDECLVIAVHSPAHLFSMNTRKRKILEQIQAAVPEIKNISFKIGKAK